MNWYSAGIVIQGVTRAGKPFRPSDWAERLSGAMSSLGRDKRQIYSPYVRPVFQNGLRCVWVSDELGDTDARAYEFLLGFARDNDLQLMEVSKLAA